MACSKAAAGSINGRPAHNHFTGRLRENFERQKDFIAEASHKLRTPLAALNARIEPGLRSAGPDAWKRALNEAEQSTDRTIKLANRLLSMARIERGARAVAEGSAELIALQPLVKEPDWDCRLWLRSVVPIVQTSVCIRARWADC